MSGRRVVITGMGAVTSMGLDVPSLWNGVLEGKSGIGLIESFPTDDFPVKIGGEVRGFDPEKFQDRRMARRTDRCTQFAIWASEEAKIDAGLDSEKLDRDRCGVIMGSGIGGLATMMEQCTILITKGARRVSPMLVPKMMINASSGEIAIRLGFAGPNYTTSSACASANHAIGMAYTSIVAGQADLMVSGGTEAALVPLGFAGFCSARALSKRNDAPEKASRPWDRDRDGFVFSEGSGVIVLEELEHAKARGATIYAEMLGFGMSDDAHHITAPHADGLGAGKAMSQALKASSIGPEDVQYINAHGTSTDLGDKAETKAIRQVFGEYADKINISSTKSMVGHLLGASGGVEAIVLAKTVKNGLIHQTLNLENPGEGCDLDYVPGATREQPVKHAVSNSFGFGGHNTAIVFGRYDG
jgi:3-oxoacyl-[acyl-carrier-protein] synthase II